MAKSRFKQGYIEIFAVTGALVGGLAVLLVYLCDPLFRVHLFLDLPSAMLVGAVMGCMSGSLIGSVFAMASSQLTADKGVLEPSLETLDNGEAITPDNRIIPLTKTEASAEASAETASITKHTSINKSALS